MSAASPEFDALHRQLRAVMLAAAPDQVVARDAPGDLILHTSHLDPKTGKPGWFGTVTVKKSYVAYHLIPLYADPALVADISAGLAKRRQGKTCFNFKPADAGLFEELAALTRRASAAAG